MPGTTVHCITYINSFDSSSIKYLLKKYTEAFCFFFPPVPLNRVDSRGDWEGERRNKKSHYWGKADVY